MRTLTSALLLVAGTLLLTACSPDNDDDLDGAPAGQFTALFDPSNSVIPFPNNVLFSSPMPDGTLNIPVTDPDDLSDPQVALNALDGFSTIAPMATVFNQAIDPDPANLAASVRVFSAALDPATLAVGAITGELSYGVDFIAAVASTDPSGQTLSIVPLLPLRHSSGYVVGINKTLRAADGQTAGSDTVYDATRIRGSLVDGSGNSVFAAFTNAQAVALEPLRQLTNAQDDALNAYPAADSGLADTFAIAWAFKTQSVGVVLAGPNGVRTLVAGAGVTNTMFQTAIGNTQQLTMNAAIPGLADIYVGTLTVPYYLTAPSMANPIAPLTSVWKGPTGLDVTGVIPGTTNVPMATGTQTIPLWVSIPNHAACVKPGAGWRVVIYQHGITTNRATLLAVADAFAAPPACHAAVAIDLPLHGLAPDHPLRVAEEGALTAATIALPTQRTFDVDYVTQDADGNITAQAPDTMVDSSGRHMINLTSLLTSRDNLRQAVADLFALHAELGNIDYDGGGTPDFDTGNVRFLGWSLGGMVGSVFLALEPNVGAAALAMPGGGIAKLLDGSPSFSPEIAAGLQAAVGIEKGSSDYERFVGAAQAVFDSADPLNYAATDAVTGGAGSPGGNGGTTLNGARGVMMFEVVGDGMANLPDQTVPNHVGTLANGFADAPAGTVPSPTAGTDPLHRRMGLNQVTASALTTGMSASPETMPLLRFTAGYHGSIADPSSSPAANQDVTFAMQGAMATHLAGNAAGFDVDPQNMGFDFAAVIEDPAP